jgi:hypothetical protein
MRGGALIQPIAMELSTLVEVTNIINRAKDDGCMLRGLVGVKGRSWAFLWEAGMTLTTAPCAAALVCDALFLDFL